MLPLQPENFRLDGCPGKLYGLVTGVLSLLERISQWTGDLKLIERFECLSPDFLSGEGPARRYEAARNVWGSSHSPNTAVWVTRPLSSHHRWSW